MSNLDRNTSNEIISSVLVLLDLLPERDIKLIENILLNEDNISLTQIKLLTGLSGPSLEACAGFFRYKSIGKDVLLIALQTGQAIKERILDQTDKCDLIWTGPIQFPVPARSTISVIQEMIDKAENSITIVGYRIEEYAEHIVNSLHRAVLRGVKVRFVIDRAQVQMPVLKRIWKTDNLPPIYSRRINKSDLMASVHAKIVIIDSLVLLVTSANLTFHGLHSNLEIGIRVRGRTATEAEKLINEVIRTGYLELI